MRRVATDSRGRRTTYDELEVGKDLGTYEFTLTQEMVDQMCSRVEEYHAWYSITSPWGRTIAPTLMNYSPVRSLFSQVYNVVGLFYKYEFENFSPMLVGSHYAIHAVISQKWIKNDREFVAYTGECVDDDGRIIWRTRRAHALDYLTRETPKDALGSDSARILRT